MRNIVCEIRTYTVLTALSICFFSVTAFASIKSVSSTGKWSSPNTWNPSGVPTAADSVIVSNNANLKIDTIGVCAALQLGNSAANGHGSCGFVQGGQLTVSGLVTLGSKGPGSTSSSGTLALGSNGILDCAGLIDAYSGSFNCGSGTLILHADNTIPAGFTNFNNLEVSSGTTTLTGPITLKGNMVLSGGMLSTSIYDVLISGNWTFSGGTLNSSSKVTFGGTVAQQIIGNGQFCLLTINNPAGVSGSLVGVSQTLTMTRGIFTISGTLAAGSAAGGNDTSYVNGTLTQNVAGTDTFYYPVGNSGYAPIKVVPTAGGNMLAISAIAGYPPSAFGSNVLSRYWSVGGSVLTCDMIFQYPVSEVHGTESAFQAGRYNGLSWDILPSSADPTTHTVTVVGIDNFNYIAIGEGSSLPIQLTTPSAIVNASNAVTISWSTVTETNNLGFTVQRKAEYSSSYTAVSPFIAGAGSSLEPHDYSFVDASVATGTYYYRIQQKDADGSTSFSPEIKVVVNGVLDASDATHPSTFRLAGNYPNPFNPATTIAFEVPEAGHASLVVYNMMGQEVATVLREVAISAGEHSVSFDAEALASGQYYYRVTFNTANRTFTGVHSMVLVK